MFCVKNISLFFRLLLISILLVSCSGKPKLLKTVCLSELTNPHAMIADNEHVVISDGVEGTTIYIYSTKDFTLYSKFGGTGEEKNKFVVSGGHSVDFDLRNDTLLISSQWKASLFTKDGMLINQFPVEYDSYQYNFFGNNFHGIGSDVRDSINYYTFNLCDNSFRKIKELNIIENSYQPKIGIRIFSKYYQAVSNDLKYYLIGSSDDFQIQTYDVAGNFLNLLEYQYERLPVTEAHKDDVLKNYREHPLFGQYFEMIKKEIVFPDFLPAIYEMFISNNFLFVITYKTEAAKSEIIKFDLDGNYRRTLMVPLLWKDKTEPYPYTANNGLIYQLVKNENTNKWDLRIVQLM